MRFVVGAILGLLIGLTAAVTAQQTTTGSGTGATPPGNLQLQLGTASSSLAIDSTLRVTEPTSFIFAGKGLQELLRISVDGTVTYQGRVLGTDNEVWDGLRAAFNPWSVCQELEEDVKWPKFRFLP